MESLSSVKRVHHCSDPSTVTTWGMSKYSFYGEEQVVASDFPYHQKKRGTMLSGTLWILKATYSLFGCVILE